MMLSSTLSDRNSVKEDASNNGTKKRPYKMADLKAFVESRLLSRSEKTLEKIEDKYPNSRSTLMMVSGSRRARGRN